MEITLIKQKTSDCSIYGVTQHGKPILWSNVPLTPHPDFFLTDLGINKKWLSSDWIDKYDKITREIVFNMNRKTHVLHEINGTREGDYLYIKQFPNSIIHMYDYNGERVPSPAIDARDIDNIYVNIWLSSIVVKNKIITVCFKINKITMFQCPKLIELRELDFNVSGRFSLEFFGYDGESDFEMFIRKYLSIPKDNKIKLDNTKYYEFDETSRDYVVTKIINNKLKNGLITICIDSSDVISARDVFWTSGEKIVLPQMFSKNKLIPKKQWFNVAYEI